MKYTLSSVANATFGFAMSLLVFGAFTAANAATIQGFGAGTAVSSADHIAEFETPSGLPHLEDGLSFSNVSRSNLTGHGHLGFPGVNDSFALYQGDVGSPLVISTIDGSELSGLEFNIGTGFIAPFTGGFWQSFRDNLLVGSGGFNVPGFPSVITFSDNMGFDALHIAMLPTSGLPASFNNTNAIAIDHVSAQQLDVPEPATLTLFGLGLLGLGAARRRNRKAS